MDKFIRYTEDFDSLYAAWDFVMEHAAEFNLPNIEIQPYQQLDRDMEVSAVYFAATVSGDVTD